MEKLILMIKCGSICLVFLILDFNAYGANTIAISTDSTKKVTQDSIKQIARIDAKKYFKNKRENVIVIAGTLIGTPLLGWIFPLYFQKKGKNSNKITIPKSFYSENQFYIDAYREEFYKIRKHKLWISYILTSSAILALAVIVFTIDILVLFVVLLFWSFFTDWTTGWLF